MPSVKSFVPFLFLAFILLPPAAVRSQINQSESSSRWGKCVDIIKMKGISDIHDKSKQHPEIESELKMLPGGKTAKLDLSAPLALKDSYCAIFKEGWVPLQGKVEKSPDPARSVLTLDIPKIDSFGWKQSRDLVVVSFPVDDAGKPNYDLPDVFAEREFPVSNGGFCLLVASLVVAIAYAIAVLARGRVRKSYSWDIVFLTSDSHNRASLSQLQILGFTLVVLWLLTFIDLRTGLLSDISQDVLLLLGISAGGAAGSKVADQMKRRLSYENWSWLRNYRWLTAYENGVGLPADPKRARWGDLLKSNGDFDIYSFQLAVFSILVAYSLLSGGLDQIAIFTIPYNLKVLLGLSNVIYIGGKSISSNAAGELDSKVTDLRNAELVWLGQVVNVVKSLRTQQEKLEKAMEYAPDKYEAYIALARQTARMVKGIYGSDGTKFKNEPIADEELLPTFP